MFRGVTHINLDAKGRIAFPSRYRERLQSLCEGELVLTVDRDHCLLVYPLPEWETIEQKLVNLPGLNRTARRLQRLLIGHATECQLDGNGRILVPPPLREFASLDKRTVLIGQGNKFELWDEAEWLRRRAEWLAEASEEEDLPAELEALSL
ncbi:MAG: division/cell wall cluster transcriptional repressor MraZ [Arhodomonas sp.]|uniref:division/cell wall cluster transcriptional repressor MraZ n=1 Tax=Arhodomonas sp. SL1 TaxID=3425691 RepID=UPI002AD86875|nr:division/cell wall cluster transcriptional repressor MraZ [Arhodomonas sp.]